MGREIKFRGLNTKGKWVYGSLVITTHGVGKMPKQRTKTWIVESAFGNGGWFNVTQRQYVRPDSVGQYLGRMDKNGIEIYESDVINDHIGIGIVEYIEEVCAFRVNYIESDRAKWFIDYTLSGEKESIEIIGNRHENKDLMETD